MIQLLLRLILAYFYSRNKKVLNQNMDDLVTVIIPTYNEKPQLLHDCIVSVLKQKQYHPNLDVIVIDDGSTEPVVLSKDIADEVKFIRLNTNQGKMRAQAEGIYAARAETQYILTVDSDTILGWRAVERLMSQFDDETGVVCGEVEILNVQGINRIVQFLYWNAFNIWRAGSSVFGQVMVCSGAISMYRFQPLVSGGILQEYLDRNIEVGNDRYITFLFLKHGWKTRFADDALAITEGPRGWKFVKQQVRWNKSFWRGIFFSIPAYGLKNWYFTLDMFLKAFSRLTTIAVMIWTFVLLFQGNFRTLFWVIFVCLFYGLIHSVAGLVITRRPAFLLFSLWGILSLYLVAPVNVWSILTAARDKWGTR